MSVHGGSCGVGGCGGCCGGCGGGGGERGGRGGEGGDGGKPGDGGGAQPGANTPCVLHASGHIAANGSVKDRPTGGTNALPLICWPSALFRGSLQSPAAAVSSGPNISASRAVASDSPLVQSVAEVPLKGSGKSVHGGREEVSAIGETGAARALVTTARSMVR